MTLLCLLGTSFTLAAQKYTVNNNILYDATTTVNLGLELKIKTKTTLLIPIGYNPWTFSENRKLKHVLIQPEIRFWKSEPYSGHFWGIHGHWATYNVGGIGPFRKLKDFRYEGWLAGGGVSYGYRWLLSPKWSMEATIGAGYAYLSHDKYHHKKCGALVGNENFHYFGLTKLGLSVAYTLK